MTDDEIMKGLKEADELLAKYKEFVKPIAEELARRKSMHVFGVKGAYTGELGCWESGTDYICLHIRDDFRGKNYDEFEKRAGMKPYQFEGKWTRKMLKVGIKHVYLGGHF